MTTSDTPNIESRRLESLFQPSVVVDDDGRIIVDFGASYVNTVDADTQDEMGDDPHRHAALLDAILGGCEVSTADKLRRLAAYIDNVAHVEGTRTT